jgi:class 3 adenylate cyclase
VNRDHGTTDGGTAADFFGTLRGPSAVRLLSPATTVALGRILGVIYLVQGGSISVAAFLARGISDPTGVMVVGLVAVGIGCIYALVPSGWALALQRFWPALVYGGLVTAVLLITVGLYFAGPRYAIGAAFYMESPIFAFYLLPRRQAALFVALPAVGFAFVLTARPDYPSPVLEWLVGLGTLVALGAGVGGFMARADELAESEREARLALDDLNRTLERRVTDQVEELSRLSRLRRFLSPQVAEAVLSEGDETVLRPHRRQIAVFFCDLRGFTSFTSGAEPEEVVEALDEYYRVVGEVLRRHDATVGTFAGDGIMAYLNDPVPCDDPAGTAVRMAMELREPMTAFINTWDKRGFSLGYGVGIAYGYATLGTIGFEGRNDYTALGSVVNLAARLCGEAGSGEILIDGRTSDAVGHHLAVAERKVVLKGFSSSITAFEVVG